MSKKQLFCVTTYSSFRHQYLVEADSEHAAEMYVVKALNDNQDLIEWQQKHLVEVAADVRPVSRADAKQQHRSRKSEGSHWLPIDSVIHKVPKKGKK